MFSATLLKPLILWECVCADTALCHMSVWPFKSKHRATTWSVEVTWRKRTWRAIPSFQNFPTFACYLFDFTQTSLWSQFQTLLCSTLLAGSRFDPVDLPPPKMNKDFLRHSGLVETLCLLTFWALLPGIKFQNLLVVFACGTEIKVESNSRQAAGSGLLERSQASVEFIAGHRHTNPTI